MYPLKGAHACAHLLVCSCAMFHVLRSEIDMSRPRSQLYFPAQGLRSEMPANNRAHVIFGELADRAADEEARRISSKLGSFQACASHAGCMSSSHIVVIACLPAVFGVCVW